MALILTIPALEDHPLITAETRPQKISQFINNLPASNVLEASNALLEEMQILNRQKVAPDARAKALEIYRLAILDIASALSNQYSNATLPLPEQTRSYAATAESLWLELGYGYKLALVDQQNKLFNLGSNRSTALVLHRAIEALSNLAMVYYHTYFTPPPSLWSDLHQLYLYAVQQSMQDMEIEQDSNSRKTTSITLTYKRALLISLADPQHLAPQSIQLVADYIAHHAQHTQLQDLGTLENHAGIFLVRLNSDKPPIPYVKNDEEMDGSSDILLITMDLVRLVHKHLQMLQAGELPKNSGLPSNGKDPRNEDMLAYLIKHWGASPKRIYNRSRKADSIELGIGFAAVHHFLHDEKHHGQPQTGETSTMDKTQSGKAVFKPTRWQVLNISAGGMALRKIPNVESGIRVGDLLSIRATGAAKWSIGILRWASHDDKKQLNVGAQLIAPSALPLALRASGRAEFGPALLLPEQPKLKQASTIIAASGTYAPARALEIEEDGKISRIMAVRLIERTANFEQFHFSRL
jgi:hypothetical protein